MFFLEFRGKGPNSALVSVAKIVKENSLEPGTWLSKKKPEADDPR